VTDAAFVDEFSETAEIGWVEEASAMNVTERAVTAEIGPRDYAIIIDNTGRFGGQEATGEAHIKLDMNIS
jgi:hypothetical protein